MPTVTLMIKPQTHVRSTQGDSIFFRIPEDKLLPPGLKRKKRLVRYNDYKNDLLNEAIEHNFSIPDGMFHIIFFIPFNKTARKNFRLDNNMRPHRVKPDVDNLYKAFADALKKDRDQVIWDARMSKVWIDHPTGYIEVSWED
jgi:Holliday junction resolvase RusA-like endonuclease